MLASAKFSQKAQDVAKLGLAANPKIVDLEKKLGGRQRSGVSLNDATAKNGGLMLYTSGTTNRPVCDCSYWSSDIVLIRP